MNGEHEERKIVVLQRKGETDLRVLESTSLEIKQRKKKSCTNRGKFAGGDVDK